MSSGRSHGRPPPSNDTRFAPRPDSSRRRSPSRSSGPYGGNRHSESAHYDSRRDRSPPRDDRFAPVPSRHPPAASHRGSHHSNSYRGRPDAPSRRTEASHDLRDDTRSAAREPERVTRRPSPSRVDSPSTAGFASPAGAAAAARQFDGRLNFVDRGAYADLDPPAASPLRVRDPPPPPREPGPGQAGLDDSSRFGYQSRQSSGPYGSSYRGENEYRDGPAPQSARHVGSERPAPPERPMSSPRHRRDSSPAAKRDRRDRSPSRTPSSSSARSSFRSRSPSHKRAKITAARARSRSRSRSRSVSQSPPSPSSESGRSIRATQTSGYAHRNGYPGPERLAPAHALHDSDDRRKRGRSRGRGSGGGGGGDSGDRFAPLSDKRARFGSGSGSGPSKRDPLPPQNFRAAPSGPAADRWAPTGPKSHGPRFAAANGTGSRGGRHNAPVDDRDRVSPSRSSRSTHERRTSASTSRDAPLSNHDSMTERTRAPSPAESSGASRSNRRVDVDSETAIASRADAPTAAQAPRDTLPSSTSGLPPPSSNPRGKLAPLKPTLKTGHAAAAPRVLAGNIKKFFPGDDDTEDDEQSRPRVQQDVAGKGKRGWKKVGDEAPVAVPKPSAPTEASDVEMLDRDRSRSPPRARSPRPASDDAMDVDKDRPTPSAEQRDAWARSGDRRRQADQQQPQQHSRQNGRDRDDAYDRRSRRSDPQDQIGRASRSSDDFRRTQDTFRHDDRDGRDQRNGGGGRARDDRFRDPPGRARSPSRYRQVSPGTDRFSSSYARRDSRTDSRRRPLENQGDRFAAENRPVPQGRRWAERAPSPRRVDDAIPVSPRSVDGSGSTAPASRRTSPRKDDEPQQAAEPESATGNTDTAPVPELPAAPVELYERLVQVGEGTYGKVYKARNVETERLVALKRIRMEAEKDGFPVTAVREIKLLQSLRHPNVVELIEVMVSKGHVYMVFEYMDHDLTGVLHHPTIDFTPAHLKSLMKQFLEGLGFIHRRGVLHRDLKGSNILIGRNGELKIADFGLARFYARGRNNDYTNRVITQWYKPPELLFGATIYGAEVDLWSAGCIFLELFARRPVFQGQDEIHQLSVIFEVTGTPSVETWPDLRDLPWYELVKPKEAITSCLRERFSQWLTPAGLDLAESLLSLNPRLRPTAEQALRLPYFTQELPRPELPNVLQNVKGEWHEYESKRARKKAAVSAAAAATGAPTETAPDPGPAAVA